MALTKWNEIHALDNGNNTVKVLKSNATPTNYEKMRNTAMTYPAICLISFKIINGVKKMAVRQIHYK